MKETRETRDGTICVHRTETVWVSVDGCYIREEDARRSLSNQGPDDTLPIAITEPVFSNRPVKPWEADPLTYVIEDCWKTRTYRKWKVVADYALSVEEIQDAKCDVAQWEAHTVDEQIARQLGTTTDKRKWSDK